MSLVRRIVRRIVRGITGRKSAGTGTEPDYIRFVGDYPSWQAARNECSGYDSDDIAERVLQTTMAVLRGEFAWERDSVGFTESAYSWPLLSCLLRCAAVNGGKLRVIDFGGALGSVFFQHRPMLQSLPLLEWRVVEQPCFVVRGRSYISRHPLVQGLTFCESMEQALQAGPADVLLLSGVLQYLQDPWQSLTEMLALAIPHVVLDRTAVLRGGESSLLSVQHVPASIYRATYPAWFLAKNQLHDCFLKGHTVISTWQCQEHHSAARGEAEYRGWLLCQKGQQGPVAES